MDAIEQVAMSPGHGCKGPGDVCTCPIKSGMTKAEASAPLALVPRLG